MSIRGSCVHVLATGQSEDPGPATICMYVMATGVFILISQERNRIGPFVLVLR